MAFWVDSKYMVGAGFKPVGDVCVCCSIVFSLFIGDFPQCFGVLLNILLQLIKYILFI